MSYIIPTSELTLTAMSNFRDKAVEAGIALAVKHGIAGGKRESMLVRHADNTADFGAGVGGYLTMPLVAAGLLYSVYATAVPGALTPALAVNQVAIYYACSVETTPCPVDQLQFAIGAAAGTTKGVFDLEELVVKLENEGFFSQCVVYEPQEVINVRVRARLATGLQARVHLSCFIIEPIGITVS